MPGMFDNWQGQLPTEQQAAMLAQRQQQLLAAAPNQKGIFGAQALGGQVAARRAAQQEEARSELFDRGVATYRESLPADAPVDLEYEAMSAYLNAAREASESGNSSLSVEFMAKARELYSMMANRQIEIDKIKASASTGDNERIKLEDAHRKEIDAQLEDAGIVADQIGVIENNAKLGTPAGDVALVFGLMKVLDPRSVVRESEFRTVEQAREGLAAVATGQSIEGLQVAPEIANRMVAFLRNTRFTDITRAQIIDSARAAAQTRMAGVGAILDDSAQLAESRGWNLESVRSGLAERVASTNVAPLSPEQMLAIGRGVKLRDVLEGRATAPAITTGDPDIDALLDELAPLEQ